jgi:hypothetical protein
MMVILRCRNDVIRVCVHLLREEWDSGCRIV